MKIQIDLNELFVETSYDNETGASDGLAVQDIIKQAIIVECSRTMLKEMHEEMKLKVHEIVRDEIINGVREELKNISLMTLDKEIIEVDKWGNQKEPTSIRNIISKEIAAQCKFEYDSYDNGKNSFTKTFNDIFRDEIKKANKNISEMVHDEFTRTVLENAKQELKRKIGEK